MGKYFLAIFVCVALCLFKCEAFAIDAGFEHFVLTSKPLSDLVGPEPVPAVDSYFLCIDERKEDVVCAKVVQKVGIERVMVPLNFFHEQCLLNGHDEMTCRNVQNHILSRNMLLANTFRALAMGLQRYPDNEFGRGTLWSVFYASQDILVGTLTALAYQKPWESPSYKQAQVCAQQNNDVGSLDVCMSNISNDQRRRIEELVKDIAMQCLGENIQQCTKLVTDYERYIGELEQALSVFDSFSHPNFGSRKPYIRLIMQDLQLQLLNTLYDYEDQ